MRKLDLLDASGFAVAAVAARSASDWWKEINESEQWQDGIFYFLCAAYALVSSVALIQLIRIQLRVPEYGWTTQKVFHLMNFIVNGGLERQEQAREAAGRGAGGSRERGHAGRAHAERTLGGRPVVLGTAGGGRGRLCPCRPHAHLGCRQVLTLVLLDLPGILFFSTYTLLVLFWAEIYHQARSLPTDKLRIVYISVNVAIYFIQVCLWIYLWINDNGIVELLGQIFIAVVSFVAALGFLLYGGRLFCMLRRFPIESKGRRKKLHEVGSVTAICFTCFLIRCIVVGFSAFDAEASLDVLDHPILNLIYYTLTEILPSALVLYILRKLPPKRISAQYHPIR